MAANYTQIPLGKVLNRVERFEPRNNLEEYPFAGTYSFARGIFVGERKHGSTFKLPKIQRIHSGDFVYCKIMAWEGAFGIVPEEAHNCVMSGAFVVYEVDQQKIDRNYLAYYFKIASVWKSIGKRSSGTNVRRQSLHPTQFEAATIPLPSLSEQQQIVARIEKLAVKVEEAQVLRQEAIGETELLISSILRQLFSSNERYQKVTLEEICLAIIDNLHSNPVYADEGIPCVRSSDVGWGKLNLAKARKTTEEEYIRRTVRGEPSVDDIVLVREGGGTGKAAIVEEGQRFSLGQRVMMLRPNKSLVLPKFFLYQLLSPAIYNDQILPRSKGSASPHLNISALRKFTFILPPLREQYRIVTHIDDILAKVDSMKHFQAQTAVELDALLPSILDKAFKGEL